MKGFKVKVIKLRNRYWETTVPSELIFIECGICSSCLYASTANQLCGKAFLQIQSIISSPGEKMRKKLRKIKHNRGSQTTRFVHLSIKLPILKW